LKSPGASRKFFTGCVTATRIWSAGIAVGAALDKHKMGKHFAVTIADDRFAYAQRSEQIAREAALDGLYAVRASLPEETLADAAAVTAYKSLSQVERAFRCLKTVDLHVRLIHHWLKDRVRAHVKWTRFLGPLAKLESGRSV
jgi:hypothetical protein